MTAEDREGPPHVYWPVVASSRRWPEQVDLATVRYVEVPVGKLEALKPKETP
jgi:hypothetical protein